ncbi:type ISP restriction/modification enzyme [Arthrobacter sp. UYCu723]
MAIAILIKNSASTGPADIQYRDIGDYLTREQKLDILHIEQSLEGTEWETVAPNVSGDWVNHRDENYDSYQALGDKATKGKSTTQAIFEMYSSGLKTNRDAWCYNFSRLAVESNMRRMIANYQEELGSGRLQPDTNPTKISWNRGLLADFAKRKSHSFDESAVVTSAYRPFTTQTAYFNREMNDMVYQLPKLFPTPGHANLVITAPGPGAAAGFFTLMYQMLPSLGAATGLQCFSLYTYERMASTAQSDLFAETEFTVIDGYRRNDNITDATLTTYRGFYEESKISKEDIFYYVYGLLHSPAYKEQYKADLMKMLPRIPRVKDFWGFSQAGRDLANLHLNYEAVEPYPLDEQVRGAAMSKSSMTSGEAYDYYRVKKLSFAGRKDRSSIVYNEEITLSGIPDQAYEYQVNGRSALEWIMDRYQVTTHKDSQIVNDPNEYCREIGNPRYILDLIKRIVGMSVETMKIVGQLPALEIME